MGGQPPGRGMGRGVLERPWISSFGDAGSGVGGLASPAQLQLVLDVVARDREWKGIGGTLRAAVALK
jgi:hypothetical protein